MGVSFPSYFIPEISTLSHKRQAQNCHKFKTSNFNPNPILVIPNPDANPKIPTPAPARASTSNRRLPPTPIYVPPPLPLALSTIPNRYPPSDDLAESYRQQGGSERVRVIFCALVLAFALALSQTSPRQVWSDFPRNVVPISIIYIFRDHVKHVPPCLLLIYLFDPPAPPDPSRTTQLEWNQLDLNQLDPTWTWTGLDWTGLE